MAWVMDCKKEIIGEPPHQNLRLIVKATDGVEIIEVDWEINPEEVTFEETKARIRKLIKRKEAITLFVSQIDAYEGKAIPVDLV